MAKSQRSSRKKALRTQRAEKVTATWAAEAEAKRLAALAACMESEPVPVVNQVPDADDNQEQQRGRAGGAAAGADGMAVDSEHKSAGKKLKKGRKAATTAAAAGGVRKKGKQTAGVKLAKEFNKRQKKQRR